MLFANKMMNPMTDRYDTVARQVRIKIAVGACRFIASVANTKSEAEAKTFIERVSGEFQDATHNAYAYRIGLGDLAICRQNDAAEPAGTAGLPMLQVIMHADLTNVTVVGTRYFGGVKLGIGGLVRAYRACAQAGLADAGRITEVYMIEVVISTPYDLLGAVIREVESVSGNVTGVEYGEEVVLVRADIPQSSHETVQNLIIEATRGKAMILLGNTNR